MFGNREVHRKLSGTGSYAAGRLAEISESLGQLAKVMKNSGEDPGLSRDCLLYTSFLIEWDMAWYRNISAIFCTHQMMRYGLL